jgi:hypothetical protein
MWPTGILKWRQGNNIEADFRKPCVRMGAWLHSPDSGLRQMAGVGINLRGPTTRAIHKQTDKLMEIEYFTNIERLLKSAVYRTCKNKKAKTIKLLPVAS